MSIYRVAAGYNIALASLIKIEPEPMSEGVKATQRTYGTGGAVHEQGLYVEIELEITKDDAEYLSFISYFGLASALTALVTVYAPNGVFTWTRYNGTAVRPEVGKDVKRIQGWPRRIKVLVKDLVAI